MHNFFFCRNRPNIITGYRRNELVIYKPTKRVLGIKHAENNWLGITSMTLYLMCSRDELLKMYKIQNE